MDRFVDVGESTRRRLPRDGEVFQMPDDGYPAVIADQRHGFGVETREAVEDYWLDYLAARNLEPSFDLALEVTPYINRARWLADCPACNAGNWAWDRNPLVCCLECGLTAKAAWLPPAVRSHAIRLLAVRPLHACNWDCHKGETIERLEFENLMLLGKRSTMKNGLIVPTGLNVPDALERYIDPKVS